MWFLLFTLVAQAEIPSSLEGIDLHTGQSFSTTIEKSKKGTVVVFLSAKCPCSISHEQSVEELALEYQKKGFQFIGVHSNSDEPFEFAHTHFKEAKLSFPIIQDKNSTFSNQFQALKTPHVFILNPKKEILFKGGVDDSRIHGNAKKFFLKEALVAIEQGKEPEVKEARALGCVIKRD